MSTNKETYERIGRHVVLLRRLAQERAARGQQLVTTQDQLNELSGQAMRALAQCENAMWLLHNAETQYRRSDSYLQAQGLDGLRFAGFDQPLTDAHVDQNEVSASPQQREPREAAVTEEVCHY